MHTKHEATAYNFNSGRPVRGRHAAAEDPDPEAPATCRRLVATAADDSVDEAKPQPSPLERGRQCPRRIDAAIDMAIIRGDGIGPEIPLAQS